MFTPSGLSPDPTSAAYKLSWWQKAILSVTRRWKDIPNWQKVACAAIFVTLSVIIAVGTAGASTGAQAGLLSGVYATSQLALAAKVALVELSIGVGLAVAGWALSSALTGSWDTNALQDEVADAMFFTGMFMFISASVNYVKYKSRSTPVTTAELVQKVNKRTAVIGKMSDLNAYELQPGEFKVADLLPDLGSARANWEQNSSVLRKIMQSGNPIKDVSVLNGQLVNNTGFLAMERNLLINHGWTFSNGFCKFGG